jgi:hypothetical protein
MPKRFAAIDSLKNVFPENCFRLFLNLSSAGSFRSRKGVVPLNDPTKLGAVKYNTDFKFSPALQEHVLATCKSLEEQPFVKPRKIATGRRLGALGEQQRGVQASSISPVVEEILAEKGFFPRKLHSLYNNNQPAAPPSAVRQHGSILGGSTEQSMSWITEGTPGIRSRVRRSLAHSASTWALDDAHEGARQLEAAEEIASSSSGREVDCWVREFKCWCNSNNVTKCPGGFPIAETSANTALRHFLEDSTFDDEGRNITFRTKYELSQPARVGLIDGELKYLVVTASSVLRLYGFQTYTQLKGEYDKWEEWIDGMNAIAPAGGKAFQKSMSGRGDCKWVFMNTQNIFVQSATNGAVFGTCLAFIVILIATRSPVMAISATITIACILVCVLGTMDMLDWELGTVESICLTIVAGFSVDYVVHLAHAYMHSKALTRAERVQNALGEMGITVLSGMATTVLASVPLFLCILASFATARRTLIPPPRARSHMPFICILCTPYLR